MHEELLYSGVYEAPRLTAFGSIEDRTNQAVDISIV